MALPPYPRVSHTGSDSSGSSGSSDFQALEDSRATVPRYLFRCYSPSSGSICSVKRIRPRTPPTAFGPRTRDILDRHLSWSKRRPSEFVSWTSSILVALVYAIRALESDHPRDTDKGSIHIAVLDVSTVPATTPIYPANSLMRTFGLPYDTPSKRYNLFWEFLMHGSIKNTPHLRRYGVIAIKQLVKEGFYTVFEPFQDADRRI
ncbi:hypothetical protein E4T43_00292 [Aureobasidium subglaciale]|nr:hypothetical protein E4T43_00292 [Aureobasidium subglaciale]